MAAIFAERRRVPTSASSAVSVLVATLVFVAPVLAHDPGQGEEVGQARLHVAVVEGMATLEAEVVGVDDCASIEAGRTAARRAGTTLYGTLEQTAPCRYTGRIDLADEGRWFVYAELNLDGEPIETWTAATVSDVPTTTERLASLYIPSEQKESFAATVAAVALYAMELAIVALVVALFRRQGSVVSSLLWNSSHRS